ncbi:F-box domain-containing protein [Mycena indigotica]|uniref:F-box domain-containing protein n=1 Tax=Mycena indigotica TaxID=2126181 RepID=A0A8H6WGL2_9AGAR|nr:F-box domain-containing protein [Mycena indigotica]KAF7315976.1 F-box domain-containing protein [Mycena indigotica]
MLSSPFSSKLGTNYAPNDEELERLSVLVSKLETQLQLLASPTIDNRDETTPESFRHEHSVLAQQIDAHKALMSPLRRVPLDILQEIFVKCLPEDENCQMSANTAPLLLGRVCSLWRETAFSTPTLWSKLHVQEPDTYSLVERKHKKSLVIQLLSRRDATKEWLQRSGSCPLSISFKGDHQVTVFQRSILPVLVPFSRRWEHISIKATTNLLPHIACITAKELPLLKSLEIMERFGGQDSDRDIDRDIIQQPWGLFTAPNVNSLGIFAAFFQESILTIHWNQLVKLDISLVPIDYSLPQSIDSLSSQRAFQIAAICPNLRIYSILLHNFGDFTPPNSVAELPHLHTFHVKSVGGLNSCVNDLLAGRLVLPKLRDLRWHGKAHPQIPLTLSYKPFCTAARYIEVIDLSFDLFNKDTLAEFLGLVAHTLRKVKMCPSHDVGPEGSEFVFDDDILDTLGSLVNYPALEVLDISFAAFSEQALVNFVTARMKGQQLKRVAVRFRNPKVLDVEAKLSSFVAAGLEANIGYPRRRS